jgi:predicted nucleic acid-binding Zn ribbon protein
MPIWEYQCTRCRKVITTQDPDVKEILDSNNVPHSTMQSKPRCTGRLHRQWSVFDFRIANKDTP